MARRLVCTVLALLFLAVWVDSARAVETSVVPTGVLQYKKAKAFDGYTIISPLFDTSTYLINMEGKIVHKWETKYFPGFYAELLPNGNILRGGVLPNPPVKYRGVGGIVQEIDWAGKVVWEYKMNSDTEIQHHCFKRMANGNTLILGWEYKTWEEAMAKGRKKDTLPKEETIYGKVHRGIWPDFVVEVDKSGKRVWEWHLWDHVGVGPDKLDINYILPSSMGYVSTSDWSHFNTVDYNEKTGEMLVNSRNFGEFYLIDKKTGKIKFRWGNDSTYGKGKGPEFGFVNAQKLYGPHHAHWNEDGSGNILIFNNGWLQPEGLGTQALEMDPRTGKMTWDYYSKDPSSFHSAYQGSLQRLPNGNTLITSSTHGRIFEITPGPKPEIVWEYIAPWTRVEAQCFLSEDDSVTGPSIEERHAGNTYNMVHRAYRYAKDYPGLAGKDLSKATPYREGCMEFWKSLK